MIYLFLDPDEFLLAQRLRKLKQALGDPEMADLNLTELDGSRISAADVLYHAGTMPFLAERRLAVVRGYLENLEGRLGTAKSPNERTQAEAVQLLGGLVAVPESNDLVFVERKLDKRRGIWRGIGSTPGIEQLHKQGVLALEALSTPDPRQLSGWIARTAKREGIAIDGRAIQMLATFVGTDLRRLSNELEKLRVYADGRAISPADVQLLVSDASEALIWDLTDAIGQRDGRKAMRALYELRRNDANAFYLLTMISRQYRLLLKVKDAMQQAPGTDREIASQVGEHPFPVKKAMAQSQRYPFVELEEILDRLLRADFAMKTGADAETELDVLVAELTGK